MLKIETHSPSIPEKPTNISDNQAEGNPHNQATYSRVKTTLNTLPWISFASIYPTPDEARQTEN